MDGLTKALKLWENALSTERVIKEGDALEMANRATFHCTHHTPAILLPLNREEIRRCLEIALLCRVPLYPVSCGLNWGYGSRLPTRDGSVLLSLSALNRITEYDEELAYVSVEPGVSFRQLAEFLEVQKSRLLSPITGTSPEASLIGNALERGVGKGAYTNYSEFCGPLEVMLSDGTLIHTGYLQNEHPVFGLGPPPGPSLQGLFFQSNFGVVLGMTIRLLPAPNLKQRGFVFLPDSDALSGLVNGLREPIQRNDRQISLEVLNDYRFLSQIRSYPFEIYPDGRLLPRSTATEFMKEFRGARWIAGVTLEGDEEAQLTFLRKKIESAVEDIRPEATLEWEELSSGTGGKPAWASLDCLYWRKRGAYPSPPDPDRDRCGVLWFVPVIPLRGQLVASAVYEIEELICGCSFEPMVSLRVMDGRSLRAVVGIFFDRDLPGEDERAEQCLRKLGSYFYKQKLRPYRLGLKNMQSSFLFRPDAGVLQSIKTALDPEGILAPGRYEQLGGPSDDTPPKAGLEHERVSKPS